MKTIQLWDRHRDRIGGGTLPMIALHNALVELGHDVWVVDSFHPDIDHYEFIQWPETGQRVGRVENPDIFIYNCYWENVRPWGKENWLYVLYPKSGWDVSAWDRIITISEYSKAAIREMWGRDADILIGGVYADDWYPGQKQNAILSCSRFFIEGDVETLVGHSKNQHVLIGAFLELDPQDWELWLTGSVLTESDGRYMARCMDLAEGDDRITFYPTLGKNGLRDLYGKARIFWHAMGYGRSNPAETEHYGYVLLKAALSGQWIVTHDSGHKRFSHYVWNTPDELVGITRRLMESGDAGQTCVHHTRAGFAEEVRRYLEKRVRT